MMISRLGLMVFSQEFIYGTWLVSMGLILSNHGMSSIIGIAYAMGGIASIISPIVLGMITDRFFASQKVLAIMNIIGALILWFIPEQIHSGNETIFLWLMFLYNLVFIPNYSLRANISLRNALEPKKDFPIITMCGTIGFITSGLLIGMLGLSGNPVSYQIGAVVSLLIGLYTFTLPNTPPLDKGKPISVRDLFFLDAFKMLKDRNYFVFMFATLLLFIPFTAYSSFAALVLDAVGFEKVTSVMTIGQISEVVFLLLFPLLFARLGYKYVFLIGILAAVLREGLFALGAPDGIASFMIIGIALHGISFNFFLVAGFMYADDKVGPEIKSQSQGLLTMFSQGFGVLLGSLITGYVYNNVVVGQGSGLVQWRDFWMISSGIAAFTAVFLWLFFKKEKTTSPSVEVEVDELEIEAKVK